MSKLTLLASIDWEGGDILPKNIQAIEAFNKKYPNVPFTRFICPSYYTRGFDAVSVTKDIKRAIKPIDEVALHIHCWESLLTHSGVVYQSKPTWNHADGRGDPAKKHDGTLEYGHDVPLGLYSAQEIEKVVKSSVELLYDNKLLDKKTPCVGFRCGGWVACTKVLQALHSQKSFTYDASGAPHIFFGNLYNREAVPLYQWLNKQWGPASVSVPHYLDNSLTNATYKQGVVGLDSNSPAISQTKFLQSVNLHEIPNTGALADYNTTTQLKNYIDRAVIQAKQANEVEISMGFHDSTATTHNFDEPAKTNIEIFTDSVAYFLQQGGNVTTRSAMVERLNQVRLNPPYRMT